MLLNIAGVLAGLIATMITVMICTVLAAKAMLPPVTDGKMPTPTPAFIAVNLVYGLGAAALGGWIAASLAESPSGATITLAVTIALLGMVSAAGTPADQRRGQPLWYLWLLPLLGALGALLGGGVLP